MCTAQIESGINRQSYFSQTNNIMFNLTHTFTFSLKNELDALITAYFPRVKSGEPEQQP